MSEEKSQPLRILLIVLSVFVGVATIFSCVVGFLALLKPEQALIVIERLASVPTSTPILVVITAPVPSPLPTSTPYPTYTPYAARPSPSPYPTYTPYPTATLTPTARPIAIALPFEDDFDVGPRPEWQPVLGTWRMVNGAYAADPSDTWSLTLVGDTGWIDYAVDVDVIYYFSFRPLRIVVRAQDASYMALETDDGDTDWITVSDGTSRVIAHSGEGALIHGGGWNQTHLRIEVQGSIYTAYADGVMLLRVQDGTLAGGRVGLGIRNDSENTPRFEDFRVTALP